MAYGGAIDSDQEDLNSQNFSYYGRRFQGGLLHESPAGSDAVSLNPKFAGKAAQQQDIARKGSSGTMSENVSSFANFYKPGQ